MRPDPAQDRELCTGRDQCDTFSVGPHKSGLSVRAGVSRWTVIHLPSGFTCDDWTIHLVARVLRFSWSECGRCH